MMSFLLPFMHFFQPGIFWPALAPYLPMLVLSLCALALGLARPSDYPRGAALAHPVFAWLVVFVLLQPLSQLHSGVASAMAGLSFWGMYLLFVLVSIVLLANPLALQRYVYGMMAGSMVIVLFGICAVLFSWKEALGGRAGAYGMYENHNDYTFIIIQIVPFLYLFRRLAGGAARLLLGAALLACVAGVALSLSRGGMLALVLEAGLLVLIGMTGRKRLLWLPVLAIVGAMAIGYQWAKRAENQGGYTAADAENSRFELWRAAATLVRDKPLLGVGSLRFAEYARFYGEISYDNRGKNTHNTFLEILTGTGLLGFFSFCALIVSLLRALHRRAPQHGPPVLDAARRATLVALYAILFRAMLDAKPHDWSFYVLCSIGLGCVLLQRGGAAGAPAASQMNPGPA
jgi:putative inorganic carbon (HCO3(-)) transporter